MTKSSRHAVLASTGLLAAVVPVVLFTFLLSRQWANIPLWDDYASVLGFVCDWQATADWQSRCSLLFGQYFSHRIVLTRLYALATLGITGEVNFLAMQVFGWAAWTGLFGLLALRWRAESRSLWLLVPVACVLMQPQSFSNHLVGMQSVQNLGVLLWGFLALDLAGRSHSALFALSVGLAGTAPFVSANGLLVAPSVALLLAATGRWRRLPVLLGVGGLAWAAYFTGYSNPQAPFHLAEFLDNAATMAGAPVALLTLDHGEARLAGLLLLGLAAVVLARPDTWRSTPVPAAWLAFIVLSILMAARGRIGWGADYMLQDRYRVYGLLLIALLYWQGARLIAPRAPRFCVAAGASFAALFCLLSYHTVWPTLINEAESARATAINRQLGAWLPAISEDYRSESVRLLQRAEAAGLYRLPALLPPATAAWLMKPPAAPAQGTISTRPHDGGLNLVFLPGAGQARPAFGLLTGGMPRAMPLNLTRSRLVDLIRRGRFTGPAYSFLLPASAVPASPERFVGIGLGPDGHPTALWQAPVAGL